MEPLVRSATHDDISHLESLIRASVRALHVADYTPAQIERALTTVYGVDSELIDDGTYFVAESADGSTLAGCGGWSKRRKLYGGPGAEHADQLLDPARDAAKIRAFFVDPGWARRGIGTRIACSRKSNGSLTRCSLPDWLRSDRAATTSPRTAQR